MTKHDSREKVKRVGIKLVEGEHYSRLNWSHCQFDKKSGYRGVTEGEQSLYTSLEICNWQLGIY